MKIEKVTVKAFVIEDKKEGLFTVALDGKGGPIISAPTHDEACEKFKDALMLSCAVQNLLAFQSAVKNVEKADKDSLKKKEPHIEFIDLEVA